MPPRTYPITIRLEPETLAAINLLLATANRPKNGQLAPPDPPYDSRSQVIRHAIRAGLDVLTDAPPIIL